MAKKKKASKLLIPPKNGLAVRMYRHGLGDCFLLAFDKPNSKKPCFVLIDCGVHMRQDEGTKRMAEVMTNLIAATGGKLDVVVVSHEHADHLSGFVQKGSPFINGRLKIDHFWAAWTEEVGDPQADRLRKKRSAASKTIKDAVEKLRNRGVAAFTDRLTGLMDFEDLDYKDLDPSFLTLDVKAKAKTKKASSNEIALDLLKQNANKVEYCEPGETLKLPGIRKAHACAYVLGPPRDEVLLKKDLPTKGAGRETYLTGCAQQRTFIQAPAFCLSECKDPREADLRHPFESALRCECHFEVKSDDTRWSEKDSPDETRTFCNDNYFKTDMDWRRIDTDWLNPAEQLALNLNSDTNNTSLTLAFELGPVQQGPVFLFVGDAQVGNWLSWRSQNYKAGNHTFSADNLLARTVLYKVGHHGSHNATVRRDPLHPSTGHPQGEPFGLELMPSGLTALIPVDHDAVRKNMPKPWHMPHAPLYKRLLEKASGRVLRSDGRSPASEGIHQLESHSPTSSTESRAFGLANVKWRQSSDKFKNGLKCPLYYDLFFEP